MDGLFSLIWVVFIVVTLTNALSGKNRKGQKKATGVPPVTAKPVTKPAQAKSFQDWINDVSTVQETPAVPAQPDALPMAQAPAAPLEPRVHPHLSLDCDLDDPVGSMDFISTEGYDPCHDDELPDRSAPRSELPALQEQPGLALEWNSDALVKSVIMQEVLTRPCQRKRR